jgi:hypothetical protein
MKAEIIFNPIRLTSRTQGLLVQVLEFMLGILLVLCVAGMSYMVA